MGAGGPGSQQQMQYGADDMSNDGPGSENMSAEAKAAAAGKRELSTSKRAAQNRAAQVRDQQSVTN